MSFWVWQSERTSVPSGTHRTKRKRAKAEGFKIETESAREVFLCQVRADFSAERHPPTLSFFSNHLLIHEGEKKR